MSVKVEYGDGELASSSFWLPSPLLQDNPGASVSRSSIAASTGTSALRPGDWRRAAAAETGGEPVQVPSCDLRYPDNTPNIDDVHSPASVNFDNGTLPCTSSPLVPRALAASSVLSGRGPSNAAGQAAVSWQLGSPSSIVSLSAGEASFRVDCPELDSPVQDASPTEMSPVRPRRALPVDSELSTPGSDGYASPSVLFVIRPSSMMRSSVQNPLYVERPTPSEGDNIAKALVLSPCADRSPASRLPRRTFESGWSSPSSAEQSISLNPSQHDDGLPPVPYLEATSSPGFSSMRQAIPSLSRIDLETPRRIIKNLSMPHDAITGADLAAAARATSPRAQRAELGLPTPCSAALPLGVGKVVVSTRAGNAAESSSRAAADSAVSSPRMGKSTAEQPGSVKVDNVDGGSKSLDLDDTIVAGRTLDQTPRKAARTASQSGEKEQHPAVKGPHEKQHAEPKLAQELTARQGSKLGQRGAKRSGEWLCTFGSWILLPLVVAVLAVSLFGGAERSSPAPSVTTMAGYKTGPVCFREQYPGANNAMPSTRSTRLSMVNTTASLEPALPYPGLVPFCWRQLPNCHVLDGLTSPVPDVMPASGVANASSEPSSITSHVKISAVSKEPIAIKERLEVGSNEPTAVALISFAPDMQLSSGDAVATEQFPLAPGTATVELDSVDADALEQLPSTSGRIFAVEVTGTGADPAVQELAQPDEHTTARMEDRTVTLDDSVAAGMTVADAKRPEQGPDMPATSDSCAPKQDVLDADSPRIGDGAATEQLADVVTAGLDLFAMLNPEAAAPAGDTDLHVILSSSEAAEVAVEAAEAAVTTHSAPGSASGMPECEALSVGSVETAEPVITADSTSDSAAYGPLPVASSVTMHIQDGSLAAPDFVHWLLTARLYGWTLPEFLLGVIGACLAGGLLAWTVEYLGSHTLRRQRVIKLDSSAVRATPQPSPSPAASAGRILRFKWPQGADAPAMEGQVVPDTIPMQAVYSDDAQREQGTGSLVWTGNKLVYFEG